MYLSVVHIWLGWTDHGYFESSQIDSLDYKIIGIDRLMKR